MTRIFAGIAIAVACVLMPAAADAHRMDEYLQATRLSIEVDRVGVEIDLTPGVNVARNVFDSIDTDGDGRVDAAERDAYLRELLRAVALSVDGRPASIARAEIRMPEFEALAQGIGTIRVRASVDIPNGGAGHHRLSYANTHRPDTSVYLVNALVPSDPQIHIAAQQRDPAQHRLTLDYDVAGHSARAWSLLAALMTAGALGVTRRPRRSRTA